MRKLRERLLRRRRNCVELHSWNALEINVETDKGDVPIWKEYFQLWYMQGTPYALYDKYAYVTL